MKGFVQALLIILIVGIPVTSMAAPTQRDKDPAILRITQRLRGQRPATPLERSMEEVIRKAWQGSGESGSGGFEEETEEVITPKAPSAEDARYEALTEYVNKHTALEGTQATAFFLATHPDNPHNIKVRQLLKSQSRKLSSKEQTDLEGYLAAKRATEGSSTKSAAKSLAKWAGQNSDNAFSITAERVSNYMTELAKNAKQDKSQKRSRLLVRIGVVALVLLLVGVVVLGGVAG